MIEEYAVRLHVLIEELNAYIQNEQVYGQNIIIKELKKVFPNLEVDDLLKIIELCKLQKQKFHNDVITAELVATLPLELQVTGTRRTIGVWGEYIHASKQQILITGYSISDFAKELIQLLNRKAEENVIVRLFIDKQVNRKMIEKIIGFNSNVKMYRLKESNEYSNLHAKIAIFDSYHAFISSSNLSYNGIINNIEIGNLLHGHQVVRLEKIFNEMLQKGYFEEI